MAGFLRYNARHCLWFPRGFRGWTLPQLDPIMSCSHGKNGKRTIYLTEPLWLFRLRQRLFCYAGRQRCGRRAESLRGDASDGLPDTWDRGPDGNRTCSYCGSIHADDLMAICRKAITDERYAIEGTDKSYKVYVRQPGVRNAGEGAIKFYMAHAPKEPSAEDQQLFSHALRLSNQRFEAMLAEDRERIA